MSHFNSWARVAVWLAALGMFGCVGIATDDGAPFVVDATPALVNVTPLVVTGKKAAGAAVLVGGVESLAAGPETTFTLSLALGEGANHFELTASSGGNASTPIAIDVVLDTVAPTVTRQVPMAGATNVALNSSVEAVFSEALDCSTLTPSSFRINGVTSMPTCTTTAGVTTARLMPGSLPQSQMLTVLLLGVGTVKDLAGNTMTAAAPWNFTTGAMTDTTPPVAPTFTAPPATTMNAFELVGGSKEAFASVEYQRSVNGTVVQAWLEIDPTSGNTMWSYDFALDLGNNLIELRSLDQSGNISTVASFTITRQMSTAMPPNPPTLDPVVSPTSVGNQMLTGTKSANTGVYSGSTLLVARDAATTWAANVRLQAGANVFTLTARDSTGTSSMPAAAQTITYNSAGLVTAGQVKIEFEVRDQWHYIGDELATNTMGSDIDIFGIDVWVEGPLTRSGATYERCFYDATREERRFTRYVGSVSHSRGRGCANTADCLNGFWWEPNFRSPNYLGALIESGRWSAPPTPFPFAPGVDRRDPNGETWPATGVFSSAVNHNIAEHPELYFTFQNGSNWNAKPRLLQVPLIDGATEASTNALFDVNTRLAANGQALGSWTAPKTYRWNLRDFRNAFVEKGSYLVSINLTADRARPPWIVQNPLVHTMDTETCWDDPAHDLVGAKRLEGIIDVDGTTPATVYWIEKGFDETADACVAGPMNAPLCNCGASTAFPCPATPNSRAGQKVQYLTPDKYMNGGSPYAARITYCPAGACP